MIRLAIAVEGETEDRFVNEVLSGHLRRMGVEPTSINLEGSVSVHRLASVMAVLYWSFDRVTSLVDFYGFGGKGSASAEQLERVLMDMVNDRIGRSWDQTRVFPYIQLHEFEGLLFSDVTAFSVVPGTTNEMVERLQSIRAQFETPEDIDDGRETAPSKRIEGLVPNYRKRLHGPQIAAGLGLSAIRRQCPRFNSWLTRLEALG